MLRHPNRPSIAPEQVTTQARQIIAERFRLATAEVDDKLALVDDLGADSLAEVELVIALEQHFDIDLPDEDLAHLRTVGDFVREVRDACQLRQTL